jgi:hypothetical protein
MSQDNFEIFWIDRGREPQCKPDPQYPHGKDIPCGDPKAKKICMVTLPYPARRCGLWLVKCSICGYSALVTTAGRPDDPRSVKLPCK